MDPLSITAGIIAILGAASTTGTTVHKLRSLRKAPEELDFLLNEVEALKNVLLIVKSSLSRIQATQSYTEISEPLGMLLRRVEDAVIQFHELLEYQLKRSEETDKHGRLKVNRSEWLRAGPDVTRIRQQIRDARGDLNTALNAHSLSTGESTRQTVLQVQSVQLIQGQQYTAFMESFNAALSNQLIVRAPVPENSTTLTSSEAARSNSHKAGQSISGFSSTGDVASRPDLTDAFDIEALSEALLRSPAISPHSTLSISTTVSHTKCPRFCTCQCHARIRGRTPVWLRNVIGELMFDYTSIIHVKPCNLAQCRQSANRSHFTYRFPAWMASKMLFISGSGGIALGAGAEWSLRVPVVVSTMIPWNAVEDGNLSYVQDLIANRKVNPYMLDSHGLSLVQTAVRYRKPQIYQIMIRLGFPAIFEAPGLISTSFARALALSPLFDPGDVSEYLNFTQLHHIVIFDRLDDGHVFGTIHQHHDQVNQQDRSGQTPLHWACSRGDLAAARCLLAWNADSNARALDGRTPLHVACKQNRREVAEALLKAGSLIDTVDDELRPPLMVTRHVEIVRLLLAHGADMRHQDCAGWTCLHWHAMYNSRALRLLLRKGADYGRVNDVGESAAHVAIMENATRGLRYLRAAHDIYPLEARPVTGIKGWHFLHYAALHAGPGVMKALAEWDLRGHDPYAKDTEGHTPDACFYYFRNKWCTVIRGPFEEEEEAWVALMESAARQNGCTYERRVQVVDNEGEDGHDDGNDNEVSTDSRDADAEEASSSEDETNADAFVDALEMNEDVA